MAEPREPRLTVSVDHSPPTRTSDGRLSMTFWAITQEGRNRLEGQAVEFLVNNHIVWEADTQHDGRTPDHEYLSDPGVVAVNFEGQLAGDASKRSKKVVRLEVKVLKPASVEHFKIKDAQTQDNMLVVLLVLDAEKNPVQGEMVYLLDKEDGRLVYQIGEPTEKSGMTRFSIPIEPKRDVTALVHGLQERIKTSDV